MALEENYYGKDKEDETNDGKRLSRWPIANNEGALDQLGELRKDDEMRLCGNCWTTMEQQWDFVPPSVLNSSSNGDVLLSVRPSVSFTFS